MKTMMKQMGMEMEDEDMKDHFDEDDEYYKVMKQLGVDPNKNDDEDILAMLDVNANDDDLL
jgi:hypothetical protein